MQATFLRGTSALAAGKRESSAAATELEELDDELLETRCRRNGLSKKGGRDMQVFVRVACAPLYRLEGSCWLVTSIQPAMLHLF